MKYDVHIIGGGLAGCEAALGRRSKRHNRATFGDASGKKDAGSCWSRACGNRLLEFSGSLKLSTSGGCFKRELALLASPLIEIALRTRVPAGHALAVDRRLFAAEVTRKIESEKNIELVREEIKDIDSRPDAPPTLIATGPLTSDPLLRTLSLLLGEDSLYFFDAISPSIENDSIDFEKVFFGSRYENEGADYLNCPFTKDEYDRFYRAMIDAERIEIRDFEPDKLFEGCLPIEVAASREPDAMRFGPMKPVGLTDPRTGERPWAVVQLRREQLDAATWNLVGFQTRLKHGEQIRVFRMIPGLENAKFVAW